MQEIDNIQLNPIIEPIPVEFTMDTIGWKVIFFLVFSTVLFGIYKSYLNYKKNKYRREAISKIQHITLDKELTIPSLIAQVMFQIKQTALISFERKKVAALVGEEWLTFLDKSVKGVHFNAFHEIILLAIYKGECKEEIPFDKELFISSSIKWIRKHAR